MTAKESAKSEKAGGRANEPSIENRKARHDYFIEDTLECGIELLGTEVKSIRAGQVSLGEGFVKAEETPLSLTLFGVHVNEYPPAGEANQHKPTRPRRLLAHTREIRKLLKRTEQKGYTLVPLKMYFLRGRVKLLIGVAKGKQHSDRRHDLAAKQAKRDIDRATSRRR